MSYVEIPFKLVHETEEAVLITDGDKQDWIPKSCIEDGQDFDYENETEINIATWFAEQEEWV